MTNLELPSYLDQIDTVKDRIARIKQREVTVCVDGLNKVFNTPKGPVNALKDISFDVHKREFVTIIGASGCGKSTLIRIMAGLESASEGQILIDGNVVKGPGAERGMVFQEYTLFPWLSVKKNVMFGLRCQGMSTSKAETEAMLWVDLVGLTKFADSYPRELSGGMKQRVAIARALATRPRVLLMDEPYGALDAQTRTRMQSNLLEIWKHVDITILFITHDLDEAIFLADRIVVLKAHPGEVQEIIEVPVARPRSAEHLISPEFLATRKHIESLIHPPHDEDDSINIHKLTNVDGAVWASGGTPLGGTVCSSHQSVDRSHAETVS